MTGNTEGQRVQMSPIDWGPDGVDLSVVWQRKAYLGLIVALSVGLGAAYLKVTDPVYESEARVLVHRQDVLDKDSNHRSTGQFLATQAEIIRSPIVVNKALESVSLPTLQRPGTDPVALVLAGLKVSPLEDTSVLQISFRGPDPDSASKLVDAIIESYSAYVQTAEADQNADVVRMLTSREENLRAEMRQLQEKHLQLRVESPQIGEGQKAFDLPLARMRNIGERLAEIRSRCMELDTRIRMARSYNRQGSEPARADVLGNTGGAAGGEHVVSAGAQPPNADGLALVSLNEHDEFDPHASGGISLGVGAGILASNSALIQEELWRAQTRASDLSYVYGPRHPEVRALRQQIAVWGQRLNQSQVGSTAALEAELHSLQVAERELSERYDREISGAKTLDRYLLQERQILDDMRRVEKLHTSTLAMLTDTQLEGQALSDGHGSVMVRVLERPQADGSRVWPHPLQFYGVCAVIGLVGGAFLLLFLERKPAGRFAY